MDIDRDAESVKGVSGNEEAYPFPSLTKQMLCEIKNKYLQLVKNLNVHTYYDDNEW